MTDVTPELRAAIRRQLQHISYVAKSTDDIGTPYLITKIARLVVAQITDVELDKVIVDVYSRYKL